MTQAKIKLPIVIPIEVDEEIEIVSPRHPELQFEGILYVHYLKQGELVKGTAIRVDELPNLLKEALKSFYFSKEELYDADNKKDLSWDDLTPDDIIEITKICLKMRSSSIPGYEASQLVKKNGRWMWVAWRIFGKMVFTAEGGVISDYNPYTKKTVYINDKGEILGVL